jgi:uncharacterized damage-inducible protein DinB
VYTPEALLDVHERTHRSLAKLIAHCRSLAAEELNRSIDGFGYATVRLQLHHVIGAEEYWVGVLHGLMLAEDNDALFPTIDSLEEYRRKTSATTENYLRGASPDELNTARPMKLWGGREATLAPARCVLRTQMHVYHHQGQVLAMCRLLGKPGGEVDFPLA